MITQTKPGYIRRALNLKRHEVDWLAVLANSPRKHWTPRSEYNEAAMDALVKHGYIAPIDIPCYFGTTVWYRITRDGVMAALANQLTINPDLRHWMQESE